MTLGDTASNHQGMTLIELVMTIVILGSLSLIMIPYFHAITNSPDPMMRQKAIALGQALMDEIISKKWDENTPSGGGLLITTETDNDSGEACPLNDSVTCSGNRMNCYVCNTAGYTPQLASTLGFDTGENLSNRQQWDDIDDYTTLEENDSFEDQEKNTFTMPGYSRKAEVRYISSSRDPITTGSTNVWTASADATDTKRIIVQVRSPRGENFIFVTVRCNI